jgi:hypothetical protein
MVQVHAKVKQPADYRKLYEKFDVAFTRNESEGNVRAEDCPWCGGPKFYMNVTEGTYQCHSGSCGEHGNAYTFLRWVHECWLQQTTVDHYRALKDRRGGIPVQVLKRHQLAYDSANDRWLIPFKNAKGQIVNLQMYYPNARKKPDKYNLPCLATALYGFDGLGDDTKKHVLLCEGVFDAIALDWNLDTHRNRYTIVATPGPFPKRWAPFFKDRKVTTLYHNDEAGREHTDKANEYLGEVGVTATLHNLVWPAGSPKDLNDQASQYPDVSLLGIIRRNRTKYRREPKLLVYHGRRGELEERAIDWIWPNHLRCGTYVSFSGRQGTFKTTIALDLCARYTTGRKMPLCALPGLPPGHVLYVFAEDNRDEVENSFQWAGGNFDFWHCLPAVTRKGECLNLLDSLGEMEAVVRRYGIRLVVIDGQNSVVGAPNIFTDMAARTNVTNKLHQFAQRLNLCLMGLRNEDAEGRALGPQSFGDIGRCVWRSVEKKSRKHHPDPGATPLCWLRFVKVSDTARAHYPPIAYTVRDRGGSHREILWGESHEELIAKLVKGKEL